MLAAGSATKVGIIGKARAQGPSSSGTSASPKCHDDIAGTQMFHAALPKRNSREETPANGIAVKRLGRMSDVTRASARL